MNRFSLYVPGDSVIHRLDPRTKLAWAALVFVLALVFNHPGYLGVVFGVVIVAAILAGRPALQLLGFAYALIPIVLLTIALWPLFERSGTPLFQVGGLPITDNGLMFAVAMGERLLVPILAVLLLFITTRRREIVAGLVKIGLPYQVGFGVTIAFGFLPILAGTGQTIIEAQRARALEDQQGQHLRAPAKIGQPDRAARHQRHQLHPEARLLHGVAGLWRQSDAHLSARAALHRARPRPSCRGRRRPRRELRAALRRPRRHPREPAMTARRHADREPS